MRAPGAADRFRLAREAIRLDIGNTKFKKGIQVVAVVFASQQHVSQMLIILYFEHYQSCQTGIG